MEGRANNPGRHAWLESPAYDLSFFLLAPLVGMAYFLTGAVGWGTLAYVGSVLLAIPHYLSSFTFFLWEENRAHQRAHWFAFFVGPPMIALLLFGALRADALAEIQFAVFFWNAYHVSRQSSGFVSLYRHRAGVGEPEHKRWASRTVLFANAACAFYGVKHHAPVLALLQRVHETLPDLLLQGCTLLAVYSLLRLLVTFRSRVLEGRGPRVPELAALATALLLFHPYLWDDDSRRATLALLVGHFLQYLGIVWLVHRRRFGERPSTSGASAWLSRLSVSTPLLVIVLGMTGSLFLAGRFLAPRMDLELPFDAMFHLLVFTHFYLDGLFWSFRDPHVRKTLGAVLAMPGRSSGRGA